MTSSLYSSVQVSCAHIKMSCSKIISFIFNKKWVKGISGTYTYNIRFFTVIYERNSLDPFIKITLFFIAHLNESKEHSR